MSNATDLVDLCLYSVPMEKLLLVLKCVSIAFSQVHIIISATIYSVIWLAFGGVLIHNWVAIAPDKTLLALNTTNLTFFAI